MLGAKVPGIIKTEYNKPAPRMPAAKLPKPKAPHPKVPDVDIHEAELPNHKALNHEVLDPKVPDAHEPGADEPGANDGGPSSLSRLFNPRCLEVPCPAIPLVLLHRGTYCAIPLPDSPLRHHLAPSHPAAQRYQVIAVVFAEATDQ